MKRRIKWLVILCAIATLGGTAVAGGGKGGLPAGYNGPVAEIPELVEGQTWTYVLGNGEELTVKLVQISGDKKTLVTTPFPNYPDCTKCLTVMDRNGEIQRVTDETGKRLRQYDYAAGWKPLDLPLWVGKKWKFYAYWLVEGQSVQYQSERKAVAFEDVRVPAGTFKAFRIEEILRSDGWQGTVTSWYAPDIGANIKRVTSWEDPLGNFQLKAFLKP